MPIDPATGFPTTAEDRTAGKLADLERRVKNLERARPTIQTGSAAPTGTPREGTPYGRATGTGEFWLYIGGTWRKVALT